MPADATAYHGDVRSGGEHPSVAGWVRGRQPPMSDEGDRMHS